MLMRTGGVQKAEVAWFISSSEAVKGSDAIGVREFDRGLRESNRSSCKLET